MNTFIIFAGIICTILGIIIPIVSSARATRRSRNSYGEEPAKNKNSKKSLTITLLIVGIVLILLGNSFVIIPTGYTGVRTTFGQVSEKVAPKGFNAKMPFVEQIVLVNNKQQDVTVDATVWGETSEKTPVYASDVVVTYQVSESKSAWLYANVSNVKSLIDDKLVSSAIKSAMVELTVETVTNRSYIEPLVVEKLQEALNEKYGEFTIIIKKVVVNDMDFEESYNAAIAEKSIARQNQERQKIENDTAIAKAEADKKVAIANAEAQAESKKIAAQAEADALLIEAEAEAEANRKISESLTDEVLDNKKIEKWDGKLPVVSGDSNAIVDIGGIADNG